MKNITPGSDQFVPVRNHILDATPWVREVRRPSQPLPGERASLAFGIITGVLGAAVTAYIILNR